MTVHNSTSCSTPAKRMALALPVMGMATVLAWSVSLAASDYIRTYGQASGGLVLLIQTPAVTAEPAKGRQPGRVPAVAEGQQARELARAVREEQAPAVEWEAQGYYQGTGNPGGSGDPGSVGSSRGSGGSGAGSGMGSGNTGSGMGSGSSGSGMGSGGGSSSGMGGGR